MASCGDCSAKSIATYSSSRLERSIPTAGVNNVSLLSIEIVDGETRGSAQLWNFGIVSRHDVDDGQQWTQGQLGLHFSAFLRTIISQSYSSLPRNISSKDVRALVRGIRLRLASLYTDFSSNGAVMQACCLCFSPFKPP